MGPSRLKQAIWPISYIWYIWIMRKKSYSEYPYCQSSEGVHIEYHSRTSERALLPCRAINASSKRLELKLSEIIVLELTSFSSHPPFLDTHLLVKFASCNSILKQQNLQLVIDKADKRDLIRRSLHEECRSWVFRRPQYQLQHQHDHDNPKLQLALARPTSPSLTAITLPAFAAEVYTLAVTSPLSIHHRSVRLFSPESSPTLPATALFLSTTLPSSCTSTSKFSLEPPGVNRINKDFPPNQVPQDPLSDHYLERLLLITRRHVCITF